MSDKKQPRLGRTNGRHTMSPYCPKERRILRVNAAPKADAKDPLLLLLAQLLATNRADMLKLRDKARTLMSDKVNAMNSLNTLEQHLGEFTSLLANCHESSHWMYNPELDPSGIPFEEACIALRRDPDAIREKTFEGLPPSLVQLVMSGTMPEWIA